MKRPAKVFYGWWIVAVSLASDALYQGTFQRSFSLYFIPIQSELGISRAAYSMADLLARLTGSAQAPLAGYIIDRVGSRMMMAVGGVLSSLGFIALYFTHSYLYFVLVYVWLLSMAHRVGYNTAAIPAVTRWFRRKRSLAISLVSTGGGLGGVVITPVVGLMIVNLGWRPTAFISGIVIMSLVIPLSLLIRQSAESMGLLPDGVRTEDLPRTRRRQTSEVDLAASGPSTVQTPAGQSPSDTEFTAREAMKTPAFWLQASAMSLRNSVWAGAQWHLVPLMVWAGVSQTTAALFVGFMSLNSLVFNPCMGFLGDRWPKHRILGTGMLVGALGMVVLMLSGGHVWQVAVFVITLAIEQSTVPLNSAILADSFGSRSFATLHGWLMMPTQLMSMTTPVWTGWVFDQTDSYFWALVPFAILFCLSSFLYWTLPRPKLQARVSQPNVLGGG